MFLPGGVGFGVAAAVLSLQRHFLPTPYGPSNDGMNGSIWSLAAMALRTRPVASHLGLVVPGREPMVYGNHPPGLLVPTAIAQLLIGHTALAGRLLALVATGLAAGLITAALRASGCSGLAASLGVAVGFGTPMVAIYGTMLDTWVVGLAPAALVLLLETRRRAGTRDSAWLIAGASCAAGLTSWLGLALACAIGALGVVRVVRRRSSRRELATLAAAAAALGMTLAWISTSRGTIGHLLGTAGQHAGDSGKSNGLGPDLVNGAAWVRTLFPPWVIVLALLGCLAAGRRRRAAALSLIVGVILGGWVVAFHEGAAVHPYWTYWATVPFAILIAIALDVAFRALPGQLLHVAAAACCLVLAVSGFVGARREVEDLEVRATAGQLVSATKWNAPTIVVVNDGLPVDTNWVTASAGRASEVRRSAALAGLPPDQLVLVHVVAHADGRPCIARPVASAFAVAAVEEVQGLGGLDGLRRCR